MSCINPMQAVQFDQTNAICPVGGMTGRKNVRESKIPVLSCEGACIRGEIARLAANIVSRGKQYGRGCHGNLIPLFARILKGEVICRYI